MTTAESSSSNNNNNPTTPYSEAGQQEQSQQTGDGLVNNSNGKKKGFVLSRWSRVCESFRSVCHVGYDASYEKLGYDYNYDAGQHGGKEQKPPRRREKGEYYLDSYNDAPWSCTYGTKEEHGTWMNHSDQAGSIMACLVWLLMLYSCVTVTLLTITEGVHPILGMVYGFLCSMALASHAKCSLTDPGAVPRSAVPCEQQRQSQASHSMCGQCQTFKPPFSHHCRICNRCVSRMDHHCPWMNNCVGAGNLKHFCLFLVYTWTCSAFALGLFGWNYFLCADEDCTFHPIVVHLVRVMTILCVGAFLFTSSMLMNVTYGLMTGIGTIDRLKKKATNTMSSSDEEPIPLMDVFGIAGYHTWWLPLDPVFESYDRVMGYSLPQRLAREQAILDDLVATQVLSTQPGHLEPSPTTEIPQCVNDLLPV
uniref:Palmitoyltransferase n=1 Tax=Grammatophora oceanica TaxID=210454 RepID=A0A7S1VQ19_9STRA|mmetsp:Transcript_52696/g.78697  ORF Transcript_52696/g.78697 Transcript_52696/m.78697 type:complete len:421 (+) Transcript_52696:78-1340(+)|eukprot:CAMPEP_0194039092 /NCGR_PEP_ID=MMETSP0009_2-20130614/11275_1 /TAXON_ID=210454 /ORGANISM="Grammatophora oceanica, Strain CCMP 410" /LENGTH=420 /DNA_ID=CAMNT_0038681823 /DNA_START=75 /DNA_END=1337 /DNA_ORIENTATION=-